MDCDGVEGAIDAAGRLRDTVVKEFTRRILLPPKIHSPFRVATCLPIANDFAPKTFFRDRPISGCGLYTKCLTISRQNVSRSTQHFGLRPAYELRTISRQKRFLGIDSSRAAACIRNVFTALVNRYAIFSIFLPNRWTSFAQPSPCE